MKFRIRSKSTSNLLCCYEHGILMVPDTGQLYQGSMNVTDRFNLERFSGKEDRSGIDIYENDYVKLWGITYKVVFDSYFQCLMIEELDVRPGLREKQRKRFCLINEYTLVDK